MKPTLLRSGTSTSTTSTSETRPIAASAAAAGRAPRSAPATIARANSPSSRSAGPWRSQPLRWVSKSGTFDVVPTSMRMIVANVEAIRHRAPIAPRTARLSRRGPGEGGAGREAGIKLLYSTTVRHERGTLCPTAANDFVRSHGDPEHIARHFRVFGAVRAGPLGPFFLPPPR